MLLVYNLCSVQQTSDGGLVACALENGLVAIFDSSKRHLQEKFCLHAHQQGASQLHFTQDSLLVTGGNDARIVLWDLAKADQNQNEGGGDGGGGEILANGHDSSSEDGRNERVTEMCRVKVIEHGQKVNWMSVYCGEDGRWRVVVADQSCDLTVYPLS